VARFETAAPPPRDRGPDPPVVRRKPQVDRPVARCSLRSVRWRSWPPRSEKAFLAPMQ